MRSWETAEGVTVRAALRGRRRDLRAGFGDGEGGSAEMTGCGDGEVGSGPGATGFDFWASDSGRLRLASSSGWLGSRGADSGTGAGGGLVSCT